MEAKKIRIPQTQINICKAIAAGDVERDRAKAEAEGIPFDYEAVKAQREQEMIVSYARELQRMQEWEETRDKAFQHVISDLVTSTKLDSYIREHVPNLKTLRDMDPAHHPLAACPHTMGPLTRSPRWIGSPELAPDREDP